MLIIFLVPSFNNFVIDKRVVDFPLPVGPVTRIKP